MLPVKIHSDHQPIVTGLRAGKAWGIDASRQNADLWATMWHLIEELGGLGPDLQVVWVPGHVGGDHEEAAGNRFADVYAKSGAALHEVSAEILEEAKAIREKQRAVARWIGLAATYAEHSSFPHRTPKSEWPSRTCAERKQIAKMRGGLGD